MPISITSSTDSETEVTQALGNPARIDANLSEMKVTEPATEEVEKVAAASEAVEGEEGKPTEPQVEKKPKNLDKRFAKLTKDRREAERKAEYWEQEAKRLQVTKPADTTPAKPAKTLADGRPDPTAFETNAEFIEALTDWKLQAAEEKRSKAAKESEVRTQVDSSLKDYKSKAGEFAKAHKDYDERLSNAEKVAKASPAVYDRMLKSGPELTYALTEDLEFWGELNALPMDEQLERIGEVKAKLKAQASSKPAEVETQTQPKPVKPVGSKVTVIADPSKMSIKEYDAKRRSGWAPSA